MEGWWREQGQSVGPCDWDGADGSEWGGVVGVVVSWCGSGKGGVRRGSEREGLGRVARGVWKGRVMRVGWVVGEQEKN